MNTLKNATILVIDSDLQVLLSFKELLIDKCKELLLQNNAEQGLKLACEIQPCIILLDINPNKMDGYEICEKLKEKPQTQHIPVIFFSSLLRSADKIKSFAVGASGYISKPFERRRASDLDKDNHKLRMDDIVSQIESCLIPRQKNQLSLQHPPPKIAELLQQYQFKNRELEILNLYISGHKRSEIAAQVYLSENTIKWYLKQIFQKLHVDSRGSLMAKIEELKP